MTPKWKVIESELEKHRDARETIIDVRELAESMKLNELANELITVAFRHFGGTELQQWRDRYAAFIREVQS